jgi:hypothetical protein
MTSPLTVLRKLLRKASFILLPIFLVLILVSVLASQFTELASRNEVLSLSSFITLLTFSGLAFNWCRVSPAIVPEALLNFVYRAGVDLFLASLLALIATFFAWLQINPSGLPSTIQPILQPILFPLHWLFLALSLLLFLLSIFHLLHIAEQPDAADHK